MDKPFFRYASVAEQLSRTKVRSASRYFIHEIVDTDFDETLVLRPQNPFFRFGWKSFMKHGLVVDLPRVTSIEQAVRLDKLPSDLRNEKFSDLPDNPVSGYTYKSFYLNDRLIRKVYLTRCLDGEVTFIYANLPQSKLMGESIKVKPFDTGEKIVSEGANVDVFVPSQTEGSDPYHMMFRAVPIIRNDLRWGITLALDSDHTCEGKRYRALRDKKPDVRESSRLIMPCEHEIAGYAAVIDYYLQKGIKLPLQMNPLAFGTQFMVYFSRKLKNNCVIQFPNDKKPRHLNLGEQEALHWGLVKRYGPGKTLMPNFERMKRFKTEKTYVAT